MYGYFNGNEDLMEILTKKIHLKDEIPSEMPKYTPNSIFESLDLSGLEKETRLRHEYQEIGMYGFVSWKWVNPLSEWIKSKRCLEVMSGRGWLSFALQKRGVKIKATDNFSWSEGRKHVNWEAPLTTVEKIDAIEAVKIHGKSVDVLFMSWPYMDNLAYQVIKTLYEINKKAVVIYIGERRGGCTADEEFFNHFDLINDSEFDKAASNYQSWFGIRDNIFLGRYSPNEIKHSHPYFGLEDYDKNE